MTIKSEQLEAYVLGTTLYVKVRVTLPDGRAHILLIPFPATAHEQAAAFQQGGAR